MSFATQLKTLREAKKWSMSELVRRTIRYADENGHDCKLDPSGISRMESGGITEPKRNNMICIAGALGVSVGQLMGDASKEPEAREVVDDPHLISLMEHWDKLTRANKYMLAHMSYMLLLKQEYKDEWDHEEGGSI